MREDFERTLSELARNDDDDNGLVMSLEAIDSGETEAMTQFLQEQAALGFVVVIAWGTNSVRFKFTPSGIGRWAV